MLDRPWCELRLLRPRPVAMVARATPAEIPRVPDFDDLVETVWMRRASDHSVEIRFSDVPGTLVYRVTPELLVAAGWRRVIDSLRERESASNG